MAIADRKPYSNPAVDSSTLEVESALRQAYSELIRYIKDELASMERDGNVISKNRANLNRINSMVKQIQARARELGFEDVLAKQTEEMNRLLDSIEREGLKLGVDGRMDDLVVDQLLLGGTRAIVREEMLAAGTLEQILIHDALGSPWGKLIGKLQSELSIREDQAITKATSSIADFHTQMRTDYFKEGGITKFLYNGPDDSRTREWCSHFVGKLVTTEMLDKHSLDWGRRYPLRGSVGLGGYNCRHELIPILPEDEEKYVMADE